jgi:5-methylcytosine-specific restriction endonuclease McrA
LTPPFTQGNFSHRQVNAFYNASVHAAQATDSPELRSGRPDCKFCHQNPLYRTDPEGLSGHPEALSRCLNCHLEKGVTQAYRHIMHRLGKKTTRSRQEIVALCSKCHADEALMKRFNASPKALTAVKTYNRTIHGRAVMLGSQNTADCISCHASSIIHNILPKEDPGATIHEKNLQETCRQCHTKTNSWFVRIAVHPGSEPEENPLIRAVQIGLKIALYGALSFLLGFLLLEIRARKRDGIKLLLKSGTSWRGGLKPPAGQ